MNSNIFGVGDCFKPDTFLGIQVRSQTCITSPQYVTTSTSCAAVWTFDKVYALNSNSYYSMLEVNVDCNGSSVICCFTVIQDTFPCPGQPTIDLGFGPLQYRVSQVYCKEL